MHSPSTLVVWADDTRAPIILGLADQVEAELGITLDVQQRGFGDIRDGLLTAGPVGEGPDVLIGAHDWLGQLVSNGAVLPLELGDLESEFVPSTLEAFTFNGELYGLPYGFENIALIRNTELVPEAPASLEEVRAISEELQANDTAEYGFLIQTGDAYHNFPVLSAFGGYIFGFNDDGSYNPADLGWNSEGGLAAAEWLAGMYGDGLMVSNVDNDVIFQLFEDGELAMFVTGPWFSQRIIDTGLPYSIDPIPGSEVAGTDEGAPFAGVQGFMLSAFSENSLLAEIFLTEYIATTDLMQSLFDADPRLPAWTSVDTSDNPNVAGFLGAGTNAVPMPSIPEMSAVWSAAGDSLTLISQGEDPIESFNNAVDQIANAIDLVNAEERIVGLPGSHQAAAGCDSDWNPACEVTFMEAQGDGIYTLTITLPAGDYEYKVAMNGAWDENYGVDGERDGGNIMLSLSEETEVTFTYDDNTNVVTDSVNDG